MHWCQDETLAAMSALPVVGVLFKKAHKLYHKTTHHKCHQEGCDSHHLHHVEEPALLPNPSDREVISMEEVDRSFGDLATIFLMFDRKMLGTREFPTASEFVWFRSNDGKLLSARLKNIFFNWDGKAWYPEISTLEKEEEFSFEDIINMLREFCSNEHMLNREPTQVFMKAQKLLKQIEDNENTGSSNQGLGQEQEANSGSAQSN